MKFRYLSNNNIHLTESGFFALSISLILLVLSFIFQTNLLYLVSAGILALIVTDLIFSFFCFKGIKLYRFCPTHVLKSKDFTVRVKIENRTFSKFLIKVQDGNFSQNLPGEKLPLVTKLGKSESATLKYTKQIKFRGVYYVNDIKLSTDFPLGFWKIEKTYPLKSKIIVYPEFYEAPQFVTTFKGIKTEFANTTSNIPGLGGNFYEIREFQPGDSLKYIHWRATARKGKLMVKQLEKFTLSNLSIIFDNSSTLVLGLGEESNLEYAIKTAGTIANRALSSRYHVKFIYYNENKGQVEFLKAYGRMGPILNTLAGIKISENIKSEQLINKALPEIEKESVAVFILLSLTEKTTRKIISLNESGIECVLVVFNPQSFAAVLDQRVGNFYSAFSELMNKEVSYFSGKGIRVYMVNQGDSIPQALGRPYMFIKG